MASGPSPRAAQATGRSIGKVVAAALLGIALIGIGTVFVLNRTIVGQLAGDWHGTGELPVGFSFALPQDLGTPAAPRRLTETTVDATFLPNGTYRWIQHNQGPSGFLDMRLPNQGTTLPPYELFHASYFQRTLRMRLAPMGDCNVTFHDRDFFTMEGPQGKLEFRRKSKAGETPQ